MTTSLLRGVRVAAALILLVAVEPVVSAQERH